MSFHSATSTTPLLGDAARAVRAAPGHLQRVPTFMQASVPSRRWILHAFLDLTLHMMFELVLPIGLYYVFRVYFSPLVSLLLSSIPPSMAVVVKGIKERRVDMMGVLMLTAFACSVLLALVDTDPKLYLLRESAMTSAMGLMLLVTLFPLRWKGHVLRPFMFYVGRQIASSSTVMLPLAMVHQHWDFFWHEWRSFRLFFRSLTAMWGLGLLSEFLVRLVLIYTMDDIDDIMYFSTLYMFFVTASLGVITVCSTLGFRHLYNLKQKQAMVTEQREEIDRIIQQARAERSAGSS